VTSSIRCAVAPAYLLACLILGGSAQGIWQNMILELAGVVILAWAAMTKTNEVVPTAARHLLVLAMVFVAVVALQLVPLPHGLWAHLGPRARISDDLESIGIHGSAQPVSLTPAAGLASLLKIIPSLALFCAMVRLNAYRPMYVAIALIAGTLAGIMLGALQVGSALPQDSPWYLYEDTNWGKAVGFFANADHMATLLVVTIPFLAAIVATAKMAGVQRFSAVVAMAFGLALVIVVGLALNGSLAGYGLALPVIVASALIILPSRLRLRRWILCLAGLLMIAAIAGLETTSIGSGKLGHHAASATQSRAEILSTTAHASRDFMPLGSGFGSFDSIYPLYEHTGDITPTYVVHAHNDYAEFTLELGLPGIILILIFLAWWSVAVWRIWRTAEARPFARAATIASGAILVHSLVDFPIRTAAISSCFAMCMALLVDSRITSATDETGALRRTRHLVI
jgi:O-antigen ligase